MLVLECHCAGNLAAKQTCAPNIFLEEDGKKVIFGGERNSRYSPGESLDTGEKT